MDWYRLLPTYWLQHTDTCEAWDAILNNALDHGPVEYNGGHTAVVSGLKVWVSNWPYAFGSPYRRGPEPLPKVATRKRLKKAIHEAWLDAMIAERSKRDGNT